MMYDIIGSAIGFGAGYLLHLWVTERRRKFLKRMPEYVGCTACLLKGEDSIQISAHSVRCFTLAHQHWLKYITIRNITDRHYCLSKVQHLLDDSLGLGTSKLGAPREYAIGRICEEYVEIKVWPKADKDYELMIEYEKVRKP